MHNIVVPVGRSTPSHVTSDIAVAPRSFLRARSSSLPNIKIMVVRGEDDAVRDEGEGESEFESESEDESERDAVHDEARPLATNISDRIPLEIYENVIEHMLQSTLPNAALVSRAWYPRAASCLYHTIIIDSRRSYDLLVTQLRTSPRVQRWLQSTHGAICMHRGNPEISFLDAFPLVFGRACPALQVLVMDHILRPNIHPTFHRALRQFQHIVSLHLRYVKLTNSAQLQRVVCPFMRLEELDLDHMTLSMRDLLSFASGGRLRGRDVTFRGPCNIRLKRLRVRAYGPPSIMIFERMGDWLVDSGICSSLVELVMCFERADNERADMDLATEHVNRLLEISGQSLTSFHCQSFLDLHDNSPWNLVHNTALRQLTLQLSFKLYPPKKTSNLAHALNELRGALSTVRSYQLEHIAVHWGLRLSHFLNEEKFIESCKKLEADSRSLHNILLRSYFDALKDVEIEICLAHSMKSAPDFGSTVAALFRRLFMPWHDRGILTILVTSKKRRLRLVGRGRLPV